MSIFISIYVDILLKYISWIVWMEEYVGNLFSQIVNNICVFIYANSIKQLTHTILNNKSKILIKVYVKLKIFLNIFKYYYLIF